MTRAEFASGLESYWKQCGTMRKTETLAEFAKRWSDSKNPMGDIREVLVDVATNGFDPEPPTSFKFNIESTRYWKAYCSVCQDGLEGKDHTDAAAAAYIKAHSVPHTKGDNLVPASRPFIGSHKLPFDSDYD